MYPTSQRPRLLNLVLAAFLILSVSALSAPPSSEEALEAAIPRQTLPELLSDHPRETGNFLAELHEAATGQKPQAAFSWDHREDHLKELLTENRNALIKTFIELAKQFDSEEDLLDAIDKNLLKAQQNGFRGEMTRVDGKPVIRVILDEHNAAFYLADDSTHPSGEESSHWKRLVYQQHFDAGEPLPNGAKPGRDVVALWYDENGRISAEKIYPKPTPLSVQALKEYFAGAASSPRLPTGWFSVGLQFSIDSVISGYRWAVTGADPSFDPIPSITSFVFAMGIGTWNGSYQKLVIERGSNTSKYLKLYSISVAFAATMYTLQATYGYLTNQSIGHGWDLFHPGTPGGANLWAHMLFTSALHNMNRKGLYAVPAIRKKNGENVGYKNFPSDRFPILKIKRSDFETQSFYGIGFALKQIGLRGIGDNFARLAMTDILPASFLVALPALAGVTLNVDYGTLLLVLSVPPIYYNVYRYAKSRNHPAEEVATHRKNFIHALSAPVSVPYIVAHSAIEFTKRAGAIVGVLCKHTFGKLIPPQ